MFVRCDPSIVCVRGIGMGSCVCLFLVVLEAQAVLFVRHMLSIVDVLFGLLRCCELLRLLLSILL